MKRPQPDIADFFQGTFIKNVGGVRKFKRLWGTTNVNGVEVLNHRQYYYPSSSRPANFEKLFKYLQIYDQVVNSSTEGIDSAWIYINKNKGSNLPVDDSNQGYSFADSFVSDNLNRMWHPPTSTINSFILPPDLNEGSDSFDLTSFDVNTIDLNYSNVGINYDISNSVLSTSIVIEGVINNTYSTDVTTTSLLNPSWTTQQLIDAIKLSYEELWNTCLIEQIGVGTVSYKQIVNPFTKVATYNYYTISADDPWLDATARYALRSNGFFCEITDVTIGYARTDTGKLYPTYVVDLEIPINIFSPTDSIVKTISSDLQATYSSRTNSKLSFPNGYWTKQSIQSMDSSDLETDFSIEGRNYVLWEDIATESNPSISSIWMQYNGVWYLKADALTNPRAYGIKYKDLHTYILSIIDSGYKKKKVPWYKKAVAFAIIIVSVVYLGPAAGLVVGSLILTVAALVFSMAGMNDWATAFMEVNKAIEPLVMVASIYLVVTGMYKAYKATQTALEEAAKAAGKEAVEAELTDVIQEMVTDYIEDFVEGIVKGATDLFSGTLNKGSLDFMAKLVKLVTMPSQIQLANIGDRNKDLQAEYDALMEEMSRETDALAGFARIYAKPATADWSMYAATFDQPYERGGGPLALGNVQRTTKQAMRKADYSDSAFENILLV